jgi:hypothetical protein
MNIPRSFPLQRFLRGPLGQLLVQLLILSQLFQGWPSWQSNATQAPNSNVSSHNPANSPASTNSSAQKSSGSGSGASSSAQVAVFGPKDYVRDRGQPFVVADSFSAPAGSCTLRIANGGSKGQYARVSSAVVILNGVVVVGPSDFNKNVALIERQVKLQNQNVGSKRGPTLISRLSGRGSKRAIGAADIVSVTGLASQSHQFVER